MNKHQDDKLAEMPLDVLKRAVEHLNNMLSEESKNEIRSAYDIEPNGWWNHCYDPWGKDIIVSLREQAGLLDAMLPSGDWCDYYVQCIEIVIGKRSMPSADQRQAA